MSDILEKFFSNLVLAAFVPAATFMVSAYFLFSGMIPPAITQIAKNLFEKPSIAIIFCSAILGFILIYTNDLIYKLYRGEYASILIPFEKRRAKKIWDEIEKLEIKMRSFVEKDKDEYQDLLPKHRKLVIKYALEFPPYDENDFSGTRFGNILRAMEYYPARRYGMTTPDLWQRFELILPTENSAKIDEAHNQVTFLINFSLLCYLLAIIGLMATVTRIWELSPSISQLIHPNGIFSDPLARGYVITILVSSVLGYLIYRLALPVAKFYANVHKSVFDLFRFKLLDTLRISQPQNHTIETFTWKVVCEFIDVGTSKYLTQHDEAPIVYPPPPNEAYGKGIYEEIAAHYEHELPAQNILHGITHDHHLPKNGPGLRPKSFFHLVKSLFNHH